MRRSAITVLMIMLGGTAAADSVRLGSPYTGKGQTCDIFTESSVQKTLGPDDVLYLSYGVRRGEKKFGAASYAFNVSVSTAEGGRRREIFHATIDEKADAGWMDREIRLKRYAGKTVTLFFEASRTAASPHPKSRDKPLFGGVRVGSFKRQENERNVILISLDTMRADRMGVAGYARDTTPGMDAAARAGVYFPVAVAAAPWTRPSHMSMMTGLTPGIHGSVSDDKRVGYRLPADVQPLAEIFQDHGYLTQSFTGSGWISSFYGFARGFDRYAEIKRNGYHAKEVFVQARKWAARHKDRRFFLFVHTYEIHAPYIHNEFDVKTPSKPIVTEANDRYDSGIRYTDRQVGGFLRWLDRSGLSKNTIVVITSDHGEEIGHRPGSRAPDRMWGSHGHTLRDITVRVPLIFYAPGLLAPRVLPAVQAREIDIVPTVLELANVHPERLAAQGESLAAVMHGAAPDVESFAISEASDLGPEQKSIRWQKGGQTWKYIAEGWSLKPGADPSAAQGRGRAVLFDLTADPQEKRSVLSEHPDVARFLEEKLKTYVASAASGVRPEKTKEQIDPAVIDQLRSLGY